MIPDLSPHCPEPLRELATATPILTARANVFDDSTRFTEYTPAGRVDRVTDANGDVVTHGYDARGNRDERIAKDDLGADVVESWVFNKADQVTSHTMPPRKAGVGPHTTTTDYDPEFGRLETIADPTGRTETRGYYADGTLKSQTWTLGADTPEVDSYWINSRGWRTKSKVAIGTDERAESTGFDRAGQRISDTMADGDVYGRQFALSGAQVRLTYPGGEYNEYEHDARGLRKEVIANFWGITIPFASYTYDDDGRQKTELLHGLGSPTRNADYNAAGQLESVTQTIRRPDNTWETYTASLTYGQDGRIATETVNAEPTITYDYDNAGQLNSAVDGVNDYSYNYGSRGNRISTTHNGTTTNYDTNPNGSVAKTTAGSDTVDYFYDNAGRRQLTADKTNGTVTAAWGTIYNTRGLPGITTTGVTGDPDDVEVRHYNADGLMTSGDFTIDASPTVTVDYQWDTNQAVPQYIDAKVDGTVTMRAYTGANRVVLQSWPNGPLLFQYDAHGSAIRKEPTNTNVVDGPKSYDPHGGGDYIHNTFVGYRAELSSSDHLYLRNRNYDPKTGQFTTQDPLDGVDGTPTVANPYHYVDNDPTNGTDPGTVAGSV